MLPSIWQMFVNSLTVYALFVTPFLLVFPSYRERFRPFEMLVDISFAIDILLSFFKVSTEAIQAKATLGQIQKEYLL
jgi:hypothetical protein